MADISASIRTRLTTDTAISALVGQRVRSDALRQDETLPAIVYRVITSTPYESLGSPGDLMRSRVQVDSYGITRADANSLAEKVRLRLHKFRGLVGTQFIKEISLVSGETHLVDRPQAGSDKRRFITTQDLYVLYQVPTS